jgi:hypothetical protein
VGEDINEKVDEEMNIRIQKLFLEMYYNNRKWYLKSGKCVEDELFTFEIKCQFE